MRLRSSRLTDRSQLRLDLKDFWHPDTIAEKEANGLVRFLRRVADIWIDENHPEVILCSSAGRSHRRSPARIPKVQFIGENRQPDTANFCCSLSFDRVENDVQFRLPLYLLYEDFYDGALTLNGRSAVEPIAAEDRKFCGALVSNPKCGTRDRFMEFLQQRGLLESGGRHRNNLGAPVAAEDSIRFRRGYRFFLAFENSSSPGYVTEKILAAMAAGCIPIYWGDPGIGSDFNPDSFIHCSGESDFHQVLDRMIRIESSAQRTIEALAPPWFAESHLRRWGRDRIATSAIEFISQHVGRTGPEC